MLVNGIQIKAARVLLGWRRQDLATAAGLHPNSVAYWERIGEIDPYAFGGALSLIESALWRRGIRFISSPGPGVRFVSRRQLCDATRGHQR